VSDQRWICSSAARAAARDPETAAAVRATTEEIAAIETCAADAANRRESSHLIRRQIVRAWVEIREAARAMPTTKAWVEADPDNVDAHVAHAAVLRLCGDPTAALPYARKAVELDPLQPEARETLVHVLQDLMQRGGRDTSAAASREALAAEAIEALQPLVDGESPNAENFVNLSYMHFQRKNPADFDAAIRVATDGLRAFPGEPRLTTNLAVYFVRGTSTPLLPRFALDHSKVIGPMQPRLLFEAAFAVRDFDAMVDYVRGYETWLTQPHKHPQFTAQHRPMILRCLQFSIGLPYCPPDVADYFSAFLGVR
jgi:tetratricopeptide (TPR) repeat protein